MEAKPADLLLCDSLILWVSDGAGEGGPSYLRTTRRRRRPPGRAAGCVGGVFPVRPAASPHLLAPPPLPGVTGGGAAAAPQPRFGGTELSSARRGGGGGEQPAPGAPVRRSEGREGRPGGERGETGGGWGYERGCGNGACVRNGAVFAAGEMLWRAAFKCRCGRLNVL